MLECAVKGIDFCDVQVSMGLNVLVADFAYLVLVQLLRAAGSSEWSIG